MSISVRHSLPAAAIVFALSLVTVAAQAQSVRVRCDDFSNRSRASVDGRDLAAGAYTARLESGTHSATSPAQDAVGGEAEFDFDSDKGDIKQGATKISKKFVGSSATGSIVDADGNVVATDTVNCKKH